MGGGRPSIGWSIRRRWWRFNLFWWWFVEKLDQVVKPFEERPDLAAKVDKVVREAERLLREAGWRLPVHFYPEFSKH